MAVYTFAYTEIPLPPSAPFPMGQTVRRPLLVVQLVTASGESLDCLACLDSGADHCVFPLMFATALGLDPLQMPMQMTGGVGSVANATYYAPLTINVPIVNGHPISLRTIAGFTSGLDALGQGLLGQTGLFEHVAVTFEHRGGTFSIEIV